MRTRQIVRGFALAAVIIFTGSCAREPEIAPEMIPEKKPAKSSSFSMKSFQLSMLEQMRKSYALADEIIIGVYEASHEDKEVGLIYYFQDFSTFDKGTLSWGDPMNILVQIQPGESRPEIIRRREFRNLLELDRTGICWDVYEGIRNIFLVEGQKNLVFLKLDYDETRNRSSRTMIDAYPVTESCRAEDVFNAMIPALTAKK